MVFASSCQKPPAKALASKKLIVCPHTYPSIDMPLHFAHLCRSQPWTLLLPTVERLTRITVLQLRILYTSLCGTCLG